MSQHNTVVYFILIKCRVDKNGESPIDAYISVNSSRTSFATEKKINVADSDDRKQLAGGNSANAKILNEYLTLLRNKVFTKENELQSKGFLLTPALLKDAVLDRIEALKSKTLMQVISDFNTNRKALVGKTIVMDTYDDNLLSERYIREFIKHKYNRDDVYLTEVKIENQIIFNISKSGKVDINKNCL